MARSSWSERPDAARVYIRSVLLFRFLRRIRVEQLGTSAWKRTYVYSVARFVFLLAIGAPPLIEV